MSYSRRVLRESVLSITEFKIKIIATNTIQLLVKPSSESNSQQAVNNYHSSEEEGRYLKNKKKEVIIFTIYEDTVRKDKIMKMNDACSKPLINNVKSLCMCLQGSRKLKMRFLNILHICMNVI